MGFNGWGSDEMSERTLLLPEEAMVRNDISPLTQEEREEIKKSKEAFKKGETIKWENLR